MFVGFDRLELGLELVTLAIVGIEEACTKSAYSCVQTLFRIGLPISRKHILPNLLVFNKDCPFVD